MSRRSRRSQGTAIGSVLALVLAVVVGPVPGASDGGVAQAQSGRPNFVIFLVDDLDALTMPYWDALPRTRELIADRGIEFTRAFAPTPICCPARSTILTGQFGHNTGVLTNTGPRGGWPVFFANGGEDRTFALALEQAGYNTMFVGKYLNELRGDHIPPGWTEWYGATDSRIENGHHFTLNENGQKVFYGGGEDDYGTDVVARKTLDFVTRAVADPDTPFLAYVNPTAPHLPLQPAARHANHQWRNAYPPVNPNTYEADISDKSMWLRNSGSVRNLWRGWNTADFRNRMGSLLAVDEMVADTVEVLDAAGALDDTYLLLLSDNGYNMGAHRLVHKMAPYEESLHVPFVMAGPGIEHGTEDRTVLLTDIAPTIIELAGLSVLDTVDGRSLVPLLQGVGPGSWRDAFPIQYVSGGLGSGVFTGLPPLGYFLLMVLFLGNDVPSYRGIHTDTHVLIEFYDQEFAFLPDFHEYELYDLTSDPWQLENLLATPAGRAEHQALFDDLKGRMDALLECAGATCREQGA